MPVVKRSIFRRTAIIMVSLIVLVVISGLSVSIQSQSNSIKESLVEEALVLAAVAGKAVEAGYVIEQWPFATLKEISDLKEVIFLWAVNPDGEIFLADNPEMWGRIIEDSDLGSLALVVKDSVLPETNEKIKLIIQPIFAGTGGSLFLGVSLSSVKAARNQMIFVSSFYFLAIIFLGVLLAFSFARSLTRPIQNLVRGVEAVGAGDLSYRLNIKTGDEIEEVADSFNKMAGDLGRSKAALEEAKETLELKVTDRTKELKQLNETLEEQVKERTKALQERVEELERFHNLTVGRELKMIELKNRLKELKNQVTEEENQPADREKAIRVQ